MGNVQITQPARRRTIFGLKHRQNSKSPLRNLIASNNPQHRNISPIRYGQNNSQDQSIIRSLTPLKFPRQTAYKQYQLQSETKQRNKSSIKLTQKPIIDNNHQRCKDIITRVRNFNDFLLQLKRKLDQDCVFTQHVPTFPSKKVSINLRLQNQKLQLQKYKQLVQRELSKTHSIQKIAIENTNHGQKILTIHYDGLINKKIQNKNTQKNDLLQKQQSINGQQTRRKNEPVYAHQNVQTNQHPRSQKPVNQPLKTVQYETQKVEHNYQARLQEAVKLQQYLKIKTQQLAIMMKHQSSLSNIQKYDSSPHKNKQRLARINKLYSSIQEINTKSQHIEQKIKDLLR